MGEGRAVVAPRLVFPDRARALIVHIDTSFLIRALLPGSPEDRRLRAWFGEPEIVLAISTIAWTEFLCGPVPVDQTGSARKLVGTPVSFEDSDATTAANLFNESGRRQRSLADCMIAATALRQGAGLATANPSDFRRFEESGLEVLTV